MTDAAGQSVVAGLAVAERLPEGVRGAAVAAVKDAFMSGLSAGSVVAAVATALAAVGALLWLPARQSARRAMSPSRPASNWPPPRSLRTPETCGQMGPNSGRTCP